jgi:hypothetical protein
LKKQLEFAQEREINAIQIVRLEGAVSDWPLPFLLGE